MKKIVLGMLVMTVLTWAAFAQQNAPAAFNSGFAAGFTLNQQAAQTVQSPFFGANTLLTKYQFGGGGTEGIPWGKNPAVAGLMNTIGGVWSWTNGDKFGGAVIAGLEVVGIPLGIIGAAMLARDAASPGYLSGPAPDIFNGMKYIGPLLTLGGAVYGVFRGVTQYLKMAEAAGLSVAKSNNPVDNLSVVVLPTPDKAVIGQVAYTIKW